jgi:hypothetical protein
MNEIPWKVELAVAILGLLVAIATIYIVAKHRPAPGMS